MSAKERLDNIRKLIQHKLWHKADQELDALYEDYCTNDDLEFTDADDKRLFLYMNEISHHLYCERMARA